MEKKKFNKLVKSIKQAGKIKRGEPLEDDLPYKPVAHDHEAFLKKAMKRKDFRESYEGLEGEYRLAREMLTARSRLGLTQEDVAMETIHLKIVDSVPWREAFPEYREEDLPRVSLLGARTKEGLTQTRLAELTGIPQRHLSMMEHGKRPIGKKNARLLGKVLKVDYRVFL